MLTRRTVTANAPLVWRQLNGIISVFKPAGVKATQVKYSVIGNLVRDLNQMEVRKPRQMINIECPSTTHHHTALPTGSTSSVLSAASPPNELTDQFESANSHNLPAYRVNVTDDQSDNVLAVGPRYEIGDVRCNLVHTLGLNTSGVMLLGLNAGTRTAFHIARSRLLRTYHIHGRLGTGTEDNYAKSRTTVSSSFGHVFADKMGGLLASIQAAHQQKMYELCGVDAQSQAAYELAAGGLIRPANNTLPLLYGVRLVQFARPEFTLEVHALNETEEYFGELVQEIGIQLHTVAHCTAVRCVRHGHFGVEGALLRGQWTVQGVVDGLRRSAELLERHPEMVRQQDVHVGEAARAVGRGSKV